MSKKVKLKNDVYLGTESIVHGIEPLIESGTWTPELACVNDEDAPTVTYQNQIGYYTKIGKLVYFNFSITGKITALNGTNNYALITGVPFLTKQSYTSAGNFSVTLGQVYDAVTTETNLSAYLYTNGIRLQYANGQNANSWKLTSSRRFYLAGSGFFMLK